MRRRVTFERTNGSASMCSMAWFTLPSDGFVRQEDMSAPLMRAGSGSSNRGNRAVARMRAMSASAPGWSSTRMRR